ncbi:MAG: threonylcarbamoyl-AMP synthase [Candidatus Marinimicrobia bacterium]|nr:threonylcarbamoyl-AMP synthase [Candidatus Neomarinimicrobiota bacterium]
MIISVHSENPNLRHVRHAVDALKEGELIVYPTDTLYGLGCDIFNKTAIEKIYALRKMDRKKPLSFICHDFSQIAEYAKISNYVYKVMKSILPGPYTIVLPATNKVPKMLVTKQKTVGIRIPDNEFALALVKEFGGPIISTTLTSDDQIAISDPDAIHELYKTQIKYVFSSGISASEPSTVIEIKDGEIGVLREGKGDISFLD